MVWWDLWRIRWIFKRNFRVEWRCKWSIREINIFDRLFYYCIYLDEKILEDNFVNRLGANMFVGDELWLYELGILIIMKE